MEKIEKIDKSLESAAKDRRRELRIFSDLIGTLWIHRTIRKNYCGRKYTRMPL